MPSFSFGAGGTSNNGASYTGASWVRTYAGVGTARTNILGQSVISYDSITINGSYSNCYPTYSGGYAYLNNNGGTMYFSRYGGNGGTVEDSSGYVWTNGSLQGTVTYSTVPAAIGAPTATASTSASGTVALSWTAPDNGGASITNYRIFFETSADGSTSWSGKTEVTKSTSTSTSFTVTGLTVGTYYRFYVNAVNARGTATYSTVSAVRQAPGNPGAPTGLGATKSTSALGQVALSWTAPTQQSSGITGYNVYAKLSTGTRTKIATLTGSGTSYTATGLVQRGNYTFDVTARSAFSDTNATESAISATATAQASGVSSPPLNLTVVTGGLDNQLVLDWDAPSDTASTLVGYYVYRSTGALYTTLTGSTSTFTATGLVPGQSYGWYVRARTTLSETLSTYGEASTTVAATPSGSPDAPTITGITALTTVAGAARIDFSPGVASVTSNIYRVYPGTTTPPTKIASVQGTSYTIYGLTPGVTYSYSMSTTNPFGEGPLSETVVSVTPLSTTVQATANSTVTDTTNKDVFNGTYDITAINSPVQFSYARVASNISSAEVTGTVGAISNLTNDNISGTYDITTSGPTSNTFSYTKAVSGTLGDIPAGTQVSSVTATNNTNVIFNGTYVVQADELASTISYSRTSTDVSSRVASGTVVNQTNNTYNGTFTLTGATETTLSYAVSSGDTQETTASAGRVDNLTSRSLYNGDEITVLGVPAYNKITYTAKASHDYRTYTFDTSTTDADPGNGKIRFNNATIGSVSAIYLDNLDNALKSQALWYGTWDDGSSLIKGKLVIAQGTNFWFFSVNGAVSEADSLGYYKIPVAYVSGTSLPSASTVSVGFVHEGVTNPSYTFSTTTTDGDPGNGVIRFNSGTIASVTKIYIDNLDGAGTNRTSWYNTWDNYTAGRVLIRNGENSLVFKIGASANVNGTGYQKITVVYVSGSLPANSANLSVFFLPPQNSVVNQEYGTVRNANSSAQLDVQYRSGWLG